MDHLQNVKTAEEAKSIVSEFMFADHEYLNSTLPSVMPKISFAPSQIALMKLTARRNLTNLSGYVIHKLTTDNMDVRMAAIESMKNMGDPGMIDILISYSAMISDDREAKECSDALVAMIKKHKNITPYLTKLSHIFELMEPDKKTFYLDMFRGVGGNEAFLIFKNHLNNSSEDIKQEGTELLFDWPDISAIDTLIFITKHDDKLRNHVKAMRGCLRILRESDIPTNARLNFLRNFMSLTRRKEEKLLIIGDAVQIPAPASIEFLSDYLSDFEISEETAIAILAKVQQDKDNINSDELAKILLTTNMEDSLVTDFISKESRQDINQPPDGFVALFNGRDLTGWQGLVGDPVRRREMSAKKLDSLQYIADEKMSSHWYVENGVLRFDGKGASLCTINNYHNFELLVDWKIEKNGDSGIYLRGMPQVQIKDPNLENGGSGGLYNNIKGENRPLEIAEYGAGHWNRFRIIFIEEKVTVYLNGRLVVDNIRMENYWERDKPAYMSGPIELQAHNSPLWFRNIFIRELPSESIYNGPLFNGRDLTGWRIINGEDDSWHVNGDILYTEGSGGGWLSTEKEYSDFILSMEFRVTPGGNSGIFLRTPQSGDPAYTGMEIQVLDDYAEKYADLKEWQYTGSIYGVEPPSQRVSLPAGEWQKIVILCEGPVVKIDLNGKNIHDTNITKYMWQEKSHPGLKRRKGFIGLQSHGSRIEYRNIYLEELK